MGMFRAICMEPRPDWNRMGPKLPAWFRPRLRRIDPLLVPQFVPPDTWDKDGARSEHYPNGVWAVCRRMPRTRLLAKTWVWSLSDENGGYQPPSHDTLTLLSRAYRFFLANRHGQLIAEFDANLAATKRAKTDKAKAAAAQRCADAMRRLKMTSYGKRRVSLHGTGFSPAPL